MATHTLGQQVGHVQQDWVEIWGPDDADGSHEVLGSAIGDNREANARLWAAAPDLLAAIKTLLLACRDGAVLPRDSAHKQAIAAIEKCTVCNHNTMTANLLSNGTPNMTNLWKCANCGYVYH